ncbi:MAG: Crp/Fnr family transcriptional regulator [Bacteroidota bacterium]|nr:Crp/Fnr family transcriptional regulator [Bacteroidota bacterium]MDP4228843.1 Crp/Fnr family transcriptional regulator [Bacteroidota bacterium]MDP4235795.1 Crp/Fnr family transcriptional regulator [Bacteroidota bacterium]
MPISRNSVNPKLIHLFSDVVGLTDEELDCMLEQFNPVHLRKKEFYLQSGEVCRQVTYVNKGCLRTYFPGEDGKEHTLYFAVEDWWIGDIESFHSGNPTKFFIQALEDCELLIMPKSGYDKMSRELPKYQEWYQMKVRNAYMASIKRYSDFKSGSAEDRYRNLMKFQPHILQRVASKYIADYLEIEPESLSRL